MLSRSENAILAAGRALEDVGSSTCSWRHFVFLINLCILFYFWLHWVFVAALAFSSCGEWRLLFVVVRGLPITVASLVAEHGL